MFKLLFIALMFVLSCASLQAQVPDFISVKKRNGITVRNYYAGGWPITFLAKDGRMYEGPIDRVANDSFHVRFYNIRRWQTIWGNFENDTLETYTVPFHYKEIEQVIIPSVKRRKGYLATLGRMMQYGGFGYDVVNVVNSYTLKGAEPIGTRRNLRNLAIATSVGAAGTVLKSTYGNVRRKSKKYKIVYVNMQ